jgi:hypothetical protein
LAVTASPSWNVQPSSIFTVHVLESVVVMSVAMALRGSAVSRSYSTSPVNSAVMTCPPWVDVELAGRSESGSVRAMENSPPETSPVWVVSVVPPASSSSSPLAQPAPSRATARNSPVVTRDVRRITPTP